MLAGGVSTEQAAIDEQEGRPLAGLVVPAGPHDPGHHSRTLPRHRESVTFNHLGKELVLH